MNIATVDSSESHLIFTSQLKHHVGKLLLIILCDWVYVFENINMLDNFLWRCSLKTNKYCLCNYILFIMIIVRMNNYKMKNENTYTYTVFSFRYNLKCNKIFLIWT